MRVVTHEDIDERLKRGDDRFSRIETALEQIALAVEPIPAMQADVSATKEIVEAWAAVKTVGKFLKWFGGIAAALAAIMLMMKAGAAAFVDWNHKA